MYDALRATLTEAGDQAAYGKGLERHADGEPFEQQKICVLTRWLTGHPVAGPVFQACKKSIEAGRLPTDRAITEIQGAINYLAAAIIVLKEKLVAEVQGIDKH